ncbi:tryptophan 7-halogenase [Alteromonas sp. ASW11-19]|uniref:Tryptophan 7-halogenase n=1 Tax=Alteromonas salexigens TaxID=2982530 RepID=A0ABT2VQJ7_9ALTE|nr:tryptophan halogenase family protein [Alteromonas salexigens]MCU7555592.1 tryptophan 7-halogenase [Alteromonas salexigens]
MQKPVRNVVIAGGGTAGWMTASLLRKVLPKHVNLRLVESEDIGIVGVGEATIPPIQTFNQTLGIDEKAFLRETHATIKLAISFENWRVPGERYLHTFGAPGATLGFCGFQHYWLRAKQQGATASLWDYDLNALCCEQGKFNKINTQNPMFEMQYAYHFDSALYGQFLRKIAEQMGVVRTEGLIEHVQQDPESGFITALQLKSGETIQGDLFIDCTGSRALLSQRTLGVEYEDWSHWLPADRALAVPSARKANTAPYTRSIARPSGWQWQIPLTHRNGNGIVYSSNYLSDEKAHDTLMGNLETEALDTPRQLRFRTGRAREQWHKNVVAIGLSSGFLEPLESTSIHLIQSGIVRLMKMFPNQGIEPSMVALYNAESKQEFETIRDFIILHYHVNERDDSDFWRDMRNMAIPERLSHKIDAFKQTSAIFNENSDIFRDSSWVQVMMGQGLMPRDYHPVADVPKLGTLNETLKKVYDAKRQPLEQMLAHDEFLRRYTGA